MLTTKKIVRQLIMQRANIKQRNVFGELALDVPKLNVGGSSQLPAYVIPKAIRFFWLVFAQYTINPPQNGYC